MFFHRQGEPLHTLTLCDMFLKLRDIEATVPPGDLVKVDSVLDANVMKRNERFIANTVTDRRMVSKVVIKDRGDVVAV